MTARRDSKNSPIGGRRRLSPLGVDVAVAVVVFGASIVNVATQPPGVSTWDIPIAGFVMLAIASIAVVWRRPLWPESCWGWWVPV